MEANAGSKDAHGQTQTCHGAMSAHGSERGAQMYGVGPSDGRRLGSRLEDSSNSLQGQGAVGEQQAMGQVSWGKVRPALVSEQLGRRPARKLPALHTQEWRPWMQRGRKKSHEIPQESNKQTPVGFQACGAGAGDHGQPGPCL